MNKRLIDFNDLIEKPKFTYLVKAGSLFTSQLDDHQSIKFKVEFSEEKNNFSEYFYKFDENKSCILIKIKENEATLPLFSALYNTDEKDLSKKIILFQNDLFSVFSNCKIKYENNFKFTINPETGELYAVIDVTI